MLKEIVLARAMYRLTRDPQNTKEVFAIIDMVIAKAPKGELEKINASLLAISDYRKLYEHAYAINDPEYDLEELAGLSEGSLGNAYALHMRENGLSADFYPHVRYDTPIHYLRNRLAKTHDVWHIAAGFNTSVPQELGLQAFYFGQFPYLIPIAVIASGLVRSLRKEDTALASAIMESVTHGYPSGKRAHALFGVKWEELWDEPINSIRSRYEIVPFESA